MTDRPRRPPARLPPDRPTRRIDERGPRGPALARETAPPAADDHLARPADRAARPVRAQPARLQARGAARTRSLGANPLLLLAAFAIFYVGFPLRGLRWALLVRRSGFALKVRDATEIIFLSWLVNCLVPAKLGDVYRAYLLKINSPVSLSRTFGTVFIERDPRPVRDRRRSASRRASCRSGAACRPTSRSSSRSASCSCSLLAGGLLTLRNFGRRILTRLPLPHRVARVLRPVRGGRLRLDRPARAAAARDRSPG